jgi:Contractile injection system tape measure protein
MDETTNLIKKPIDGKKVNYPEKKRESTEEIFIFNAGLVLLHPFLSQLFRVLELTGEKNEWLHASGQAKAVLVTQYMISGEEETTENILPLNKLLCGMPLELPVEQHLSLTEVEKDHIRDLLNAVVSHWSILKDTSADGLRNTFLIREGKLAPDENGWLLQVEQKAWDVLLTHLPWGISMIKTPWMDELLRVEWG